MAFRARKSFKIAKGVRLNVSKGGVGMSAGVKGARYSTHSSGRKTTYVGVPGSGLSYVHTKGRSASKVKPDGDMTEAQQRRLLERFHKKQELAAERRDRPLQKLKELYAAGKISKEKFNELSKRDEIITIDFVIFGRGAGLKLAERYLQGKVNNDEFESLRNELLGDAEAERDKILADFKSKLAKVDESVKQARASTLDGQCSYCSRPKKFYSPLLRHADFKVCVPCKAKFKSLTTYAGYNGKFYSTAKMKIEIDKPNDLHLNVLPEHILEYR